MAFKECRQQNSEISFSSRCHATLPQLIYLLWSFLDVLIWLSIVTKKLLMVSFLMETWQKKREQRSTLFALCNVVSHFSMTVPRIEEGTRGAESSACSIGNNKCAPVFSTVCRMARTSMSKELQSNLKYYKEHGNWSLFKPCSCEIVQRLWKHKARARKH